MKSAVGLCGVTLWLLGCSSLEHRNSRQIEATNIECTILAREKSLFNAITQDDAETYSEHLSNNVRAQDRDEDNLDLAIAKLFHQSKPLTANTYDPHRFEVRPYYGTIKLRRHNTLAYVNYGFGTVGCLGCRALRVGDINSAKSIWRLESDGHWRRLSNKAGPKVSVYKYKHNETRCLDIQNQD